MSVRLIAITKPVVDEVPDSQALLAYCARVSSTANQLNHETGGKLLQSLVRRKEWSPFEMVSLTMEIETTRDITRQILRHRSFSFQEFSQRYAEVSGLVERDVRFKGTSNRQGSRNPASNYEIEKQAELETLAQENGQEALRIYQRMIDLNVAPECARAVLPEGLTPSRLYMAGTLRSWIHYTSLRMGHETQKEHRIIAEECYNILLEQFLVLGELA